MMNKTSQEKMALLYHRRTASARENLFSLRRSPSQGSNSTRIKNETPPEGEGSFFLRSGWNSNPRAVARKSISREEKRLFSL
ncbi:MAG: hypothetical protein J6R39_02295 [Oscillospiraceae bacterium]|nr:hypothetical protein [Oscillospiraceae bacterium]